MYHSGVGTIQICEIQAATFTALTALERLYLYNNNISHSKYEIIWICCVSLVGIYSYKLAPGGRIQIIVIKIQVRAFRGLTVLEKLYLYNKKV